MEYSQLKVNGNYSIIGCGHSRLCELGMCATHICLIKILYSWIYVFHVRGALIAVRRDDLKDVVFKEEL